MMLAGPGDSSHIKAPFLFDFTQPHVSSTHLKSFVDKKAVLSQKNRAISL